MKLCDACHRHVRPSEGACPFCGRCLRTTGAGRLGAVVLLGVLEAACSGRPLEETGSDSATVGPTTTTTGTTTTGSPTTSTTSSTSTTGTSTTGPATTSSTGELTSTGDVDTTDTGCSFYGGCPSDFVSPILCSTFAQDCPEGQKCMPFSSDGDSSLESTDCFPVARDPDPIGAPCTVEGGPHSGLDSCDVGALCADVDPQTLAGECVALCGGTPDSPECPADMACAFFNDALSVCVLTCDPLMPACEPGDVCVANGNSFACVVDVSGDQGAEFEACEFTNDCDLGLACLSSDLASECDVQQFSCCLAYCDLGAPTCSGQGAECMPWFEEGQAPAGLEDVGICTLPP